jgi:hypothetical protein
LIEALPSVARAPVLDAISALQLRIAEYIADILKSEETSLAVQSFIDRRVDDLLARRISDVLDEETFEQVLGFLENRFRGLVTEAEFEKRSEILLARVSKNSPEATRRLPNCSRRTPSQLSKNALTRKCRPSCSISRGLRRIRIRARRSARSSNAKLTIITGSFRFSRKSLSRANAFTAK